MNINLNRREFRRKLGTRTNRREGTKTKGIGSQPGGKRGKAGCPARRQQFRYPRRQRPRPAVLLLNAMIRKAQAQQAAA